VVDKGVEVQRVGHVEAVTGQRGGQRLRVAHIALHHQCPYARPGQRGARLLDRRRFMVRADQPQRILREMTAAQRLGQQCRGPREPGAVAAAGIE
jgi:hypothetical protein